MKSIIILGRTKPLLDTARYLHLNGYKIKAIITAPASQEYSANEEDFKSFAQEIGVPFFLKNSLDDELRDICKRAEIGISMNWVSIIEGCLSIHFMKGGQLDVGKIVLQERFPLALDTYIGDIYRWLEDVLPSLFLRALEQLQRILFFSKKKLRLMHQIVLDVSPSSLGTLI